MSAEQPKIEPQRVELILGAWLNEDELPPGYPYHEMFEFSKLGQDGMGGVRIFPKLAESGRTSAHRYTSTACQHGKNDSSASVQPEGMTAEEFHGPVCSACAWENADKCEKRVSCTDKIKFAQVYADRLRGQGAPQGKWAAMMAEVLPCGHANAQHMYHESGDDKLEPCALRGQGAPKTEYPKPCGICDGVIQSAADLDWHGCGNCREIPDAVLKQLSPLKDAYDALLNDSRRDDEGNLVIYLYRAQEIAKELARHSFGDGTQQRGQGAPDIDAQVNDVLIVMHNQMQLRSSDDSFPAFADWKDCPVAKCAADAYLMVLRERGQGAPKQSLDDRMWAKRIADGIFGIGPCPYVGMMERKPAEGFIAGELAEFRAQGAETRESPRKYTVGEWVNLGAFIRHIASNGDLHVDIDGTRVPVRPANVWRPDDPAPSSSEARNAALDEAAKAMCKWCADGSTADYYEKTGSTMHAVGGGNIPCRAAAIRSLQRPEEK